MSAQVDQSADSEYVEISEKLSASLANKDAAILREVYHENAEIWHNYDNKTVTPEEIIELVEVVFSSFTEIGFRNVRRYPIEKGFVQQHDIVGTHVNGEPLRVPGCQVVTVEAGKIIRLEEYIDPAPLFALLSAD